MEKSELSDSGFRREAIHVVVCIVSCQVIFDVSEFISGFTGYLSFLFLIVGLGWLISLCWALFYLIAALARRKFVASALVAAIATVSVLLARPGAPFFERGFVEYIRHSTSPEEIEEIALLCLKQLPKGGKIVGPRKSLNPEGSAQENQVIWGELGKHPFIHYARDTCTIFVEPPSVTFAWGGALAGHWGIKYDPSKSDAPGGSYWSQRFAEKIVLYSDKD